jgi:hypothetical protein
MFPFAVGQGAFAFAGHKRQYIGSDKGVVLDNNSHRSIAPDCVVDGNNILGDHDLISA